MQVKKPTIVNVNRLLRLCLMFKLQLVSLVILMHRSHPSTTLWLQEVQKTLFSTPERYNKHPPSFFIWKPPPEIVYPLGDLFNVYFKAESISFFGINCTLIDWLDSTVVVIVSFGCHFALLLIFISTHKK